MFLKHTEPYGFLLRLSLLVVLCLGLVACENPMNPPKARVEKAIDIETDIRTPAVTSGEGLQIKPLQNPGQRHLLQQAKAAEAAGDIKRAEALFMQALSIQPQDPEILQSLAENNLQQQRYEQANTFAQRSYVVGPKVGELCSRNWLTIAAVREHYQNPEGVKQANEYAKECATKPPERF